MPCRDDTASTRVCAQSRGGVRRFDFVFKCKRPINFAGFSARPVTVIIMFFFFLREFENVFVLRADIQGCGALDGHRGSIVFANGGGGKKKQYRRRVRLDYYYFNCCNDPQ